MKKLGYGFAVKGKQGATASEQSKRGRQLAGPLPLF
jgi:hypothetical protein